MRFDQLRQFIAIGEYRHYRQAAEQTGISTSALTRSIQTLESELGCQLLIRSTRSVRLTDEGEVFYQFCRQTLAQYANFKRNIQLGSEPNVRVLRVGVHPELNDFVESVLPSFKAQYQNVEVLLTPLNDADLQVAMLNKSLDLTISIGAQENQSDTALPHNIVVFTGQQHPLAQNPLKHVSQLRAFELMGCFSGEIESMRSIERAADLLAQGSNIKFGHYDLVAQCVEGSQRIAFAGKELLDTIMSNPNLAVLHSPQESPNNVIVKRTHPEKEDPYITLFSSAIYASAHGNQPLSMLA